MTQVRTAPRGRHQIDSFRRPAGPYNLVRTASVQEPRNRCPRCVVQIRGTASKRMERFRGIRIVVQVEPVQRGEKRLRTLRRRRAVEVDQRSIIDGLSQQWELIAKVSILRV